MQEQSRLSKDRDFTASQVRLQLFYLVTVTGIVPKHHAKKAYLLLPCTFHTVHHKAPDAPSASPRVQLVCVEVRADCLQELKYDRMNEFYERRVDVCVGERAVGTTSPFIFVLPNTSLDDLFHLWNGYLVKAARLNSLQDKNTMEC